MKTGDLKRISLEPANTLVQPAAMAAVCATLRFEPMPKLGRIINMYVTNSFYSVYSSAYLLGSMWSMSKTILCFL